MGYDDLPAIKTKMYLSAIDCWMSECDYPVHFMHDDLYALWGLGAGTSFQRPDTSTGLGGGNYTGWLPPSMDSRAGDFDTIRSSVDSLFSRWEGLPDGSNVDAARTAAAAAASVFGAAAHGTTVTTSEILNSKDTVKEVTLNKISGAFTSPFLAKYDEKFSNVVAGSGAVCAVLQTVYATEAAMWSAIRDDVATTLAQGQSAFALKAEQDQDAWLNAVGTVTFTVLGAIAGAVATVATAGTAAPAVAALVAASTVAAGATSTLSVSGSVSTAGYQDIWTSIFETLDRVNDNIFKLEEQMYNMLVTAENAFVTEIGSFNLDRVTLDPWTYEESVMTMARNDTNHITRNMGTIATALEGAYTSLNSVPSVDAVQRDATIGLGETGPMVSAISVHQSMLTALNATATEYARGKGLFDATVEDFFSADAAASAKVEELLADEALVGNNPL